jgi:hypothetical protein
MLPQTIFAYVSLILAASPAPADSVPKDDIKSRLSNSASNNTAALAGSLRELLLRNLPTPLYEASFGWGHTAKVKGFHLRPHAKQEEKNDGTWKKVRITAENLPGSLVLELRNVQHSEPGRATFTLFLAFDARVDFEQQKWKAGLRLYSGSARARLQIQLTLDCELLTRLEWKGSFAPDVIFRVHVVRSDLTYRHLVVEHILGVGGDAAKLLGEAIQHGIHQWRPSLERNLLNKANAAIEKAADTNEVRMGLSSLLR